MFRRKKNANTALQAEKPMIEGYLLKRAVKSGRNWRRRYFALYGTKLVYWTKRGDKKPKGEMLITEDFFVSDATTKGFGFMISDFTTTYYLGADSAAVKEFWTHTLRRVIRKLQQDIDYFGTKGGVGVKVAAAVLPITQQQAQTDLSKRMEAYESSKKLGVPDPTDSSSSLLYVKPTHIMASSSNITAIQETKTTQKETKKEHEEGPISPRKESRRRSSSRKSGRQTTPTSTALVKQAEPSPAPPTPAKHVGSHSVASFVGYVETNFGSQVDLSSSDEEESSNDVQKTTTRRVSPPLSPAAEDKATEKGKRTSIKRHSSKRRSSSRTSSPKHGTQSPKSISRSPSSKSITSTTPLARPSLAATRPVTEKPNPRPSMPMKVSTPAPAPIFSASQKTVSPAKPKSAMNSRVAMWQNRADTHNEKQATNVFSGGFTGNKALKKGDPGYGKAVAGSKTEQRAKAATEWVDKQIAQLVDVIKRTGKPSAEHGNKIATTFGPLFIAFQDISDSLVGILMRAKRRKELWYDGDMLFQGRDDGVVIYIM